MITTTDRPQSTARTWALAAAPGTTTPRRAWLDLMPWLTICVTRHHRHPGKWVVQAPPLIEAFALGADDLPAAQVEALAMVRAELELALIHLDR